MFIGLTQYLCLQSQHTLGKKKKSCGRKMNPWVSFYYLQIVMTGWYGIFDWPIYRRFNASAFRFFSEKHSKQTVNYSELCFKVQRGCKCILTSHLWLFNFQLSLAFPLAISCFHRLLSLVFVHLETVFYCVCMNR